MKKTVASPRLAYPPPSFPPLLLSSLQTPLPTSSLLQTKHKKLNLSTGAKIVYPAFQ